MLPYCYLGRAQQLCVKQYLPFPITRSVQWNVLFVLECSINDSDEWQGKRFLNSIIWIPSSISRTAKLFFCIWQVHENYRMTVWAHPGQSSSPPAWKKGKTVPKVVVAFSTFSFFPHNVPGIPLLQLGWLISRWRQRHSVESGVPALTAVDWISFKVRRDFPAASPGLYTRLSEFTCGKYLRLP